MLSCNSRQKVILLEIDCQVDVDWIGCVELTKDYDQDLSMIKELSIVPYGAALSTPPPLNVFQIESTCLVMRIPQDLMFISKIRSKSIEMSVPCYNDRSHSVIQAFVSQSNIHVIQSKLEIR